MLRAPILPESIPSFVLVKNILGEDTSQYSCFCELRNGLGLWVCHVLCLHCLRGPCSCSSKVWGACLGARCSKGCCQAFKSLFYWPTLSKIYGNCAIYMLKSMLRNGHHIWMGFYVSTVGTLTIVTSSSQAHWLVWALMLFIHTTADLKEHRGTGCIFSCFTKDKQFYQLQHSLIIFLSIIGVDR